MAYDIILQDPESDVVEKWVSPSDLIVKDDGGEQRISLASLPKRSWTGTLRFDDVVSLRRYMATMFGTFSSTVKWPNFTLQVKLKSAVAAAADTMYLNPRRSDFRQGAQAIIIEDGVYELFTVDEINADHITSVAGLTNSYSKRARVAPVLTVYPSQNASVSRRAVDGSGTASFQFFEYGFLDPFILEGDEVELTLYRGLPVLNRRAIGVSFDTAIVTGNTITDYGGLPSIRDRWLNSAWGFTLNFLWHRVFNPEDLNFWKTFADYCRGSTNPFYFPSTRADLEVHTDGVGSGTAITLEGTEYSQHYYVVDSMRDIVVTKPDGTQHFCRVTNVVSGSGNDVLTINPALPAGDWSDHTVGFMYLVRIQDDAVTLSHRAVETTVTLNVRTTDG